MADAGVGEAALIAAAAESAAAASAAGATAAAVLPEVIGAGATLAGTAGTAAAAAAPEVIAATAAPAIAETVATAAAPALAETTALAAPTAAEAAAIAPTAVATTDAPIFLGATQAEPLLGSSVAGGDVALSSAPSEPLLGSGAIGGGEGLGSSSTGLISENLAGAELIDKPTGTIAQSLTGKTGIDPGLPGRLGNWWETSSVGDKLSAAGKVLGGVSTASKALTPSTPQSGPKRTMQPGKPGQPMGGEQALAQVIEGLLKRRDAYLAGQGVPVAYRPRSLLG